MGKMKHDIDEVERKLNFEMKELSFVHPDMEVKEDFEFDTYDKFIYFVKTYIKITRTGSKQATGKKKVLYKDILREVGNCIGIILLHYQDNAKDEEDKKRFLKTSDLFIPMFTNKSLTIEQWTQLTSHIMKM